LGEIIDGDSPSPAFKHHAPGEDRQRLLSLTPVKRKAPAPPPSDDDEQ
jgi:hypothetical protein